MIVKLSRWTKTDYLSMNCITRRCTRMAIPLRSIATGELGLAEISNFIPAQVICKQGERDMGDKGKKDKGKKEQQKKAQLNPKEKRKLKKEKKK